MDDVEAELDADSNGPLMKVGLRPDMSTLSSLDIPEAPDPLRVLRSITHGGKNRKKIWL